MRRHTQFGGKPAPLARKMTLSRLGKIRDLFGEISCIWSDVDSCIESECERAIEQVKGIEADWKAQWAEQDEEQDEGGAA